MAGHQFTLSGTRERKHQRARKKVRQRTDSLAAQLDQATLEKVLADVDDDLRRVAVLAKLQPSLTFTPDPDTLARVAVRLAIRANLERALVDDAHLVAAILDCPPETRRMARDLLVPLCPWTPSADALTTIEAAIPSGLVTPEGTPADARESTPAIVLTDM
jgi:hypothetical protein